MKYQFLASSTASTMCVNDIVQYKLKAHLGCLLMTLHHLITTRLPVAY